MIKRRTAKIFCYILLVVAILGLCINITSIGLQAGLGYIGYNTKNKITLNACTSTYLATKYSFIQYQQFAAFIGICFSVFPGAAFLGIIVTMICGMCLEESPQLKQYPPVIGPWRLRALYLLGSLALLSGMVHAGYFIAFRFQLSSSCVSRDLTYITVLAILGLAFIVVWLVGWILTLIMNSHILQYLDDHEKDDRPIFVKNNTFQTQLVKKTEGDNERTNLVRKEQNYNPSSNNYLYPNYSDHKDQREREMKQRYLTNDTRNQLFHKNNRRFEQPYEDKPKYEDKRKQTNNRQALYRQESPSTSKQKYSSPRRKLQQSKNQRISFKSPFEKQYQNRTKQEIEQDALKYYKKKLQTSDRRSKYYDEDLYRNPKPSILTNQYPQQMQHNRRKLHTNYDKAENPLQKPSSKKKGMLIDYIRGKYN